MFSYTTEGGGDNEEYNGKEEEIDEEDKIEKAETDKKN